MNGETNNNLVLSAGWRWVRLGDHVTKIGSGLTPQGGHKAYKSSGIPLIRSQNVHINRFALDGLAFISAEQDEGMTGSRVQPSDVLLNITGASIGRVCVVPTEFCPANVNQHVCVIRSDDSINSEFLAFYLSSPSFQKFIWSSQAGATRQALTKAMIEDFAIPFAPLAEQRRIAGRLREQLAEVARSREAVEAQLAAAQALPAALLREVFQCQEAQQWPLRELGSVCELLPSKSISTAGDTEVRAITTACLTESGFRSDGIKTARMRGDDSRECVVSAREILVARSNTPDLVGRVAMFPGEPQGVVASDLTIRLWCGYEVQPEFLTAYLSFLFVEGYWKEVAGGASSSMKKITRSQIAALRVPVPPPPDSQRKIVEQFNASLTEANVLESAVSGKLDAINRLPAALLATAFNGQCCDVSSPIVLVPD